PRRPPTPPARLPPRQRRRAVPRADRQPRPAPVPPRPTRTPDNSPRARRRLSVATARVGPLGRRQLGIAPPRRSPSEGERGSVPMADAIRVTGPINAAGLEMTLETGKLAPQADGAVVVRVGDTTILSTVVTSKPREGIDLFPL